MKLLEKKITVKSIFIIILILLIISAGGFFGLKAFKKAQVNKALETIKNLAKMSANEQCQVIKLAYNEENEKGEIEVIIEQIINIKCLNN